MLYFDDMLILARSKEEAKSHLAAALELFIAPGFVINTKKSVFNPVQKLEFFGFWLDSAAMTISLPETKLHTIRKSARSMMEKNRVSACERAGTSPGHDGRSTPSNPPSPPSLQEPGEGESDGAPPRGILRRAGAVIPPNDPGTILVGDQIKLTQWQTAANCYLGSYKSVRCLDDRLGGILPRKRHRGTLDATGTSQSH